MALQTLNDPWQGHTGAEVEEFIKGQLAELSGSQLNTLQVNKVNAPTSYNKDAEEYTISYSVVNKVNNNLDSAWWAVYSVNGTQVGATFYPSVYTEDSVYTTPNLIQYLSNNTEQSDNVTITVYTDYKPNGVSINTRVSCVYAEVTLYTSTENLNVAQINRNTIQYITRYQGASADLIVTTSSVYGGNEQTYRLNSVTSNTTPKSITLNETNTGVRVVDAYLSLNGGAALSEHVKMEMINVDSNTESGTFIATREVADAVVYEDYTVHFGVYDGNNRTSNITIQILDADGNISAEATIATTNATLSSAGVTTSYTFTVPTSNFKIKFLKDDTEIRVIDCSGKTSDISWIIKDGAELFLTAKGKTNAQVNSNIWTNNGYSTTFTDVEFDPTTTNTGNGWYNSESLHLTGDARAVVNCTPLYDRTRYSAGSYTGGGIFALGRTLSFKFKVTNVNNQNDMIIKCWDPSNEFGFFVRPDAIYAKIYGKEIVQDFYADQAAATNNRRFADNQEIEVTLTVGKAFDGAVRKDPEVFLYVNGEIAGFTTITHTTDVVSQNNAMPIEFGCSGANLDLYYVRTYNTTLTKEEVYHNYVMSLNSQNDIKLSFDKNNYDLNSINDAIAYCKAQSLKPNGNCSIVVTTELREGVTNTKDTNDGVKHELWCIFFKDGKVDTTRTRKYVAVKEKGLRIRVQGTSTAAMPVKNLRYDAKGECYVVYWNEETDWWFDIDENTEKVTKLAIVLEEGDIPCSLLTTKTNYNESTATRNLPNAMWVDDAINALYNTGKAEYADIITPPQKVDRRVRQAIKGVPAIQYFYNLADGTFSFTGKVDMITDKANMDVFGFTSDEDHSIELRSNSADACNFHTSKLDDTGVKLADGETNGRDLFEYRFPDADTTWNKVINGHMFFGEGSPLQRLWDFVYNCSQDPAKIGKESNNGVVSTHTQLKIKGRIPYILVNGQKQYTVARQAGVERYYEDVDMTVSDTAEYRRLKFYAEAKHYIVVSSLIFNGLVSLTHLWTDQRAKNTFFTHFKGDVDSEGNWILRLLPYDIDTSWRGDNDSRLRYDYTREYEDPGIYDDDHSEFWQLMDLCFGQEYVNMYNDLNNLGFYQLATLRRYYKDRQVEAYNSTIYNADAEYKYTGANSSVVTESVTGQGTSDQTYKAHGSAIEDLDWWMQGRLYYEGGKYFSGSDTNSEYTKNDLTFNIAMGKNFGDIDLNVTTYQRAYTNWLLGTVLKASGYSEANGTQVIHFDNLITTASDNRIRVFGQKQIKSFGDLSPLLIENIQSNEGLNVVDMIVGSTASTYKNEAFSGFGTAVYGACKLVNVSNCTGYSNADLSKFPILETLLATGCTSMVTCALPSSATLKYCYLPANLRTVSFVNKYSVEEIQIEGISNISSVTMENSNKVVQDFIFDKILKPIYG